MRVLVLTGQPISAGQLRSALPDDVEPTRGEVMIVAPALQQSPIKFWLSDADEAIARAEDVSEQSVHELREQGVSASGDTGESDPMAAIEDALQSFAADRIVLFTGAERDHYKGDVDPAEVSERFGVPVDRAEL